MRSGPPIGKRIREACEALEQFGPSTGSALCVHIPDVEPSNMGKYCARAVVQGLMTVDRSHAPYVIYSVVPDWREIADARMIVAKVERVQPVQFSRWRGVNSVFQMGAA